MLPSGTVTFLFTDIEGSTQLWEKQPEAMKSALARHDLILREAVEANHGYFIKKTGDGVHAVFSTALDAIHASVQAQCNLQAPLSDLEIKVRMGVHTGEAELRDGDYYGQSLNRAARIMSVGHGGQILLSAITAGLVREQLTQNTSIKDLGEHRLKGLSNPEHLWQLITPELPIDFPALQSLSNLPNNLPIQLTSFIGREKEIADLKTFLKTARLVTLTGSGGTGKTRLSLEVGAEMLTNFPNGVWLVELAPLSDSAQIIPTLALTFGLSENSFSPLATQVMDYLRDKNTLVLLDNCEHLIQACARLVNDLLHQCAGMRILASSREVLGIPGEIAYHTPSLAGNESLRLFVERACATNSNFNLNAGNTPFIAQICDRLDGIPLAIELAAARTRSLSPEQIAARLDDRFRLLVGGSRIALPRQQTLRALIDWSYDLLSDDERQLFCIASVFVGGWTLEALEAIAVEPNTLDHLEQLVNKSLVVTEERTNEMRYFMLETIRQYAREKLFDVKQASTVRDRHFSYFDELAEKLWDAFRSQKYSLWRARAEDESENLRAALEWGMQHNPEAALNFASNFLLISGLMGNVGEKRDLLKSALKNVRSVPPVEGEANLSRQVIIAKALFSQAMVGMSGESLPKVTQYLQEAISISRLTGDQRILGYSLEMYSIVSQFNHAPGGAEAAQEGLTILSGINDRWGMTIGFMNMTRIASSSGDMNAKQKYYELLTAGIREVPLSLQGGMFYLSMGFSERGQGNYDLAKQHFENGLTVFRQLHNKNFENVMLSELGHLTRMGGDFTRAREIYKQTITGWYELGARPAVAHQLECYAFIAIAEGQPTRASQLLGAAEALRAKVQSPMADDERVEYDQSVARLRSMLAEKDFNSLWAGGRAMSMEQAIQFALM